MVYMLVNNIKCIVHICMSMIDLNLYTDFWKYIFKFCAPENNLYKSRRLIYSNSQTAVLISQSKNILIFSVFTSFKITVNTI